MVYKQLTSLNRKAKRSRRLLMFKVLKTVKKVCPICEAERELQFGNRNETLKIRDEDITVESKVYFCPIGKHYFHDIDKP